MPTAKPFLQMTEDPSNTPKCPQDMSSGGLRTDWIQHLVENVLPLIYSRLFTQKSPLLKGSCVSPNIGFSFTI